MKARKIIVLMLVNIWISNNSAFSQKLNPIVHDKNNKTITLSDKIGDLIVRLNYSEGCVLDKIIVKGNEVTGNGNCVYSGVRFSDMSFSSMNCTHAPVLTIKDNSVFVDSINFGNSEFAVRERWVFRINGDDIQWQIERHYLNNGVVDEISFPCWQFNSIQTWDGAILDNGGVAWNRFLDEPGDTYGANTAILTFWNRSDNSCLRIIPDENPELYRTATFCHQENHALSVVQSISTDLINTKYGLKRFLQTGQNVYAPVTINKSNISVTYTLRSLTYNQEYDRGELKGINEESVNEMLNTIGRYGVVDKYLYGSNGWRTGYAVLQEPWLALFGSTIDSPDFINGFSQTLEFEKKHAVMPDGRVLPRWHHDSTDAMPNTYREDGFYECQWGYMLDSQPAFAINVAEQFDMTGNIEWLRSFKPVCEKVLDYMIKRDSDGNGLFEVVQKTYKEQKGTDWLDVVWASYEVASINAFMYMALIRWSDLEKLLGDIEMSEKYKHLALKLKTTYNKNIADGGFWNPEKNWYVHWREKDGSVYGDNLVSVINFLSIGYGLCDDAVRRDVILGKIEELMQNEKLFIWPSCFFPYEDNVGLRHVNYPYPNYENGDLFLAWAELGTRCYAEKNPEIALKYIRNVIDQYEADGLAHQRYTRFNKTGVGDDILSNNIMAVVGLYRNIYGIRPQYNRLYLEPHLTKELDGTKFKYWMRNQEYVIELSKEKYSITINNFCVSNNHPFAVNSDGDVLEYFNGNNEHYSLKISSGQPCLIDILKWGGNSMSWSETGKNQNNLIHHELQSLKVNAVYDLLVNNKLFKKYTADSTGIIRFDYPVGKNIIKVQIAELN